MPASVPASVPDLQQLGRRWIEAWNNRDLEAILEHYAEDVEVRSPRVTERFGTPDGRLVGKNRLGDYFAIGLEKPDLHFELVEVLEGSGTMTVLYRRENGALVADCSELDSDGRITRMIACYGAAAEPTE